MDDILSKFNRYIRKDDDLTVIVLKGHLIVEEELEQIINKFLPNAEAVNRAKFSFFSKASLAQAICWKRPNDEIWPLIFAINSLRNDLAHNLESDKRVIKVEKVLQQHAEMSVNDPDYHDFIQLSNEKQLILAFMHVLGFLQNFKKDVENNSLFWHSALRRQESLLDELAGESGG